MKNVIVIGLISMTTLMGLAVDEKTEAMAESTAVSENQAVLADLEVPPEILTKTSKRVADDIRKILTHDVEINKLQARERILLQFRLEALNALEEIQLRRKELKTAYDAEVKTVGDRFGTSTPDARMQVHAVVQSYRPIFLKVKQEEEECQIRVNMTNTLLEKVRRSTDIEERRKRLPLLNQERKVIDYGLDMLPCMGSTLTKVEVKEEAVKEISLQQLNSAMDEIEELAK